jgi:hypothetical protein
MVESFIFGSPTLTLAHRFLGDRNALVMQLGRHQHAARRIARLTGVHHHALHATGDRGLEVGVVENDVGRLAAEFLGDALDGIGGGLGHQDAGAGRAGEGHHVDIGMRAQRRADTRAVAVDEVEHAGRHAGGMQHFSEDRGVERRHFGRLQHHRAAGGECRQHLAGDLVDRPVPRRDETAHAHRLATQRDVAALFLEHVVLQHFDGGVEMGRAHGGLRGLAQPDRRAHFARNGLDHFGITFLVGRANLFQERHALVDTGTGIGREGGLGGGNGLVHVLGIAQHDLADDLFGGGIDDV